MTDVNDNKLANLEKLNLSCPFTWNLKKILPIYTASDKRDLDEIKSNDIPLMTFMLCIVSAFENTESSLKDEDAARNSLKEAGSVLKELHKDRETSEIVRAAEHIYQATTMYIFYKNDRSNELKYMSQEIVAVSELSEEELAALTGCKSFALSLYHLHFVDEVISLAETAVKGNKTNALWHFVLGRSLRKKRRNFEGVRSRPSTQELMSFNAAARYSSHAFYKIYNIQARQEASFSRKMSRSQIEEFSRQQLKMYEEIWRTCPENPIILLKVVLGMMRCKHICNWDTIHSILDKVDELSKHNIVSFHYRGRAYKLQKNYKKAFEYLKRAGDMLNFAASNDYLYCMFDTRKKASEIIEFLLEMREKYKHEVVERQQKILLNLAIMYFDISDFKRAAQYFAEAIEIQSQSQALKEPYSLCMHQIDNTYRFVSRELLPKCNPRETVDYGIDDEYEKIIQKLRRLVRENNQRFT